MAVSKLDSLPLRAKYGPRLLTREQAQQTDQGNRSAKIAILGREFQKYPRGLLSVVKIEGIAEAQIGLGGKPRQFKYRLGQGGGALDQLFGELPESVAPVLLGSHASVSEFAIDAEQRRSNAVALIRLAAGGAQAREHAKKMKIVRGQRIHRDLA